MDVEGVLCPICMDDMTITDINFRPCPCGFQLCGFCFHRIETSPNSQCPSCRAKYKKENIEFTPPDEKEIQRRLRSSKKANRKKNKNDLAKSSKGRDNESSTRSARSSLSQSSPGHLEDLEDRSHLKGMRVVQRNLVYVTNLPIDVAEESILIAPEYFSQYGGVQRIAVTVKQLKGGEKCAAAYVTFEDLTGYSAYHCIRAVDGSTLHSRNLRAAFGTTKYCSNFLRNLKCKKTGCTFLHHIGETDDTLSPKEMATGKHYQIFQEMSVNAPEAAEGVLPEGVVRMLPRPGTFTKDGDANKRRERDGGGRRDNRSGKRNAGDVAEKTNTAKQRNKRGAQKSRSAKIPRASPAPIVVVGAPQNVKVRRPRVVPAASNSPKKTQPSVSADGRHGRRDLDLVIGSGASKNLIIGPPPHRSPFMLDNSTFVAPTSNKPIDHSAPSQPQKRQPAKLTVLRMPPIRKGWSLKN